MNSVVIRLINRFKLYKKIWLVKSRRNSFNPIDQLLIFSDPRGGSTWITELLKTINNTAIIWEPLNISEVESVQKLGFGWRQYIPEDVNWIDAKKMFDQILSGRILNEWTLLKTTTQEFFKAEKLIVKICRGNMLLPWLVNQYSFKYKPIYLVRHPFAVVCSQLRQGGWNSTFSRFQIPKIPYNEVYREHYKFMSSLETKEELLTAMWCLTNKIPLESKVKLKYLTIHYEDLVQSPQQTVKTIFSSWAMPIPEGIDLKYRQASSTTVSGSDVTQVKKQLELWRHRFDGTQIRKMSKVLKYFEIKVYNENSVIPSYEV